MVKHKTVYGVRVKIRSYYDASVDVMDEDYNWYEVPYEVLKKQLLDLIFYPMEQKDGRCRLRVGGFGYKNITSKHTFKKEGG